MNDLLKGINPTIAKAIAPFIDKPIKMICNECDKVYYGHKSSICPECQSHDTIDLKTAQDNFNYAKFKGDCDFSELPSNQEKDGIEYHRQEGE